MLRISEGPWLRIFLLIALNLWLLGRSRPLVLSAAQVAARAAAEAPAAQASAEEEQNVLNEAFRSAENNPQLLIKNLEAFLARFPQSSRRDAVMRAICNYAMQANAPAVVVRYGEVLLQTTPDDPPLLGMVMEALARQDDQASRTRAIQYCSRLVAIAKNQRDRAVTAGGSKTTSEQWTERISALLNQRAGLYQSSGDSAKAFADYEESYATHPSAQVAEQLGDILLKKGESAGALDYYLLAFIFPDTSAGAARRLEVRRKLASLYLAQHHSEKGLGDLALSRYDALIPKIADPSSPGQTGNTGRHDPFDFVLERLDSAPLPLAAYRGKVMVMEFWATWCGPCREEGKLIDQVAGNFRADSRAAFLALNVDQDRSGVPAFLKQQAWTVPVAYAQGLDQLLSVQKLPTVVVFDRQGRIVLRLEGLDPGSFVGELSKHLRETLQESAGSKQ